MKDNIQYEKVPSDPTLADVRYQIPLWRRWCSFSFVIGCTTTVVLVVIAILMNRLLLAPKTSAQIEAEEWNYCGRSSVVAKARGCVMEPLYYGWMPPQCVYQDLSESYPAFADRTYYSDFNMTEELSQDQLWNGEYSTIYTSRYHDQHCLFQWRKLQYAMTYQMEFLDNKTINSGHSTHCADQISRGCELPTGGINVIKLGFYRCRKTIW